MNENKNEIEVKEQMYLRIKVESVTVPSDGDIKKGIKSVLNYRISYVKNNLPGVDVKTIKCDFSVTEKEVLNKTILLLVTQTIVPQNFEKPKIYYRANSYEIVK